jgi:hydrogenase expression/formation protein HypC
MCLAVPMQIVSIDGESMVAEIDGVKREASLMMLNEKVAVGDYVLIHAGFAKAGSMRRGKKPLN